MYNSNKLSLLSDEILNKLANMQKKRLKYSSFVINMFLRNVMKC